MLFNSLEYAIFLPIIFLVYWMISVKYRVYVLMFASFWFYLSWNWKYFFLFFIEIFITYFVGKKIDAERKKESKKDKIWCFGCVIFCVALIFIFKYYNFTINTIYRVLFKIGHDIKFDTLNLVLPVGISFYTFQCIGYIIDIYRGNICPVNEFPQYAAFISFFPQLVAGPIERAGYLLPQMKEPHEFEYSQATYGLKLMAWGYFKKMVIADRLAIIVDDIWGNLSLYSGIPLSISVFYFGIQIYCDFSGYSDIARGTAKLFAIELTENFKSPYLSTSIKEFWSRWHISLSLWLKDYIYVPLGGNRKGGIRYAINILITFLISGLWHGANWTFVAWGWLHGLLNILQRCLIELKLNLYRKLKMTPYRFLKGKVISSIYFVVHVFITDIMVFMLWILFRSQTLSEAKYIFKNIFLGINLNGGALQSGSNILWINLFLLLLFDLVSMKIDVINCIGELKCRWIIYVLFILFIYYQIPQTVENAFLYFQF